MNKIKKHQYFFHNLTAIYTSASVRMLIPLLIIPLMASRLGADEFGRLSFILIWSGFLSLIVEGGFITSANRLAVTSSTGDCWLLARRVFSARCLLSCLALLLAYIITSINDKHSSLHFIFDFTAIFLLSCAMGWPAIWYLEATRQLKSWSKIEAIIYSTFVVSCLFFAKTITTYLFLYTLSIIILSLLSWLWLCRDLRIARKVDIKNFKLFSLKEIPKGLILAWKMLPTNIAGAMYSFALPALATGQLSRVELGAYFMADRIVRIFISAASPLFSITFPRAVELHNKEPSDALKYSAKWAIGGLLIGCLIFVSGITIWPLMKFILVNFLPGINYEHLGNTLSILGLLLPLLLCWRFFINWMLSTQEFDIAYRVSIFSGALVGLIGVHNMGENPTAEALAWVALRAELSVIIVATSALLIKKFFTNKNY